MKKAFDSAGSSGAESWKMVMKTIAETT